MRATRIPYALLLNFGRPQLQYGTFDLAKLPSGSVIETATAPQIKKTPSQAVESESSPRSTDNSAGECDSEIDGAALARRKKAAS